MSEYKQFWNTKYCLSTECENCGEFWMCKDIKNQDLKKIRIKIEREVGDEK